MFKCVCYLILSPCGVMLCHVLCMGKFTMNGPTCMKCEYTCPRAQSYYMCMTALLEEKLIKNVSKGL